MRESSEMSSILCSSSGSVNVILRELRPYIMPIMIRGMSVIEYIIELILGNISFDIKIIKPKCMRPMPTKNARDILFMFTMLFITLLIIYFFGRLRQEFIFLFMLSIEIVRHVAKLAKIALSDDEIEKF